MGTNYYLHENVCECCGRGDKPAHIGKSSTGWAFLLHTDELRRELDDWAHSWSQPKTEIRDEYGCKVTPEEMLLVITVRRDGWRRHVRYHGKTKPGKGSYDLCPYEFF